MKFLTFNKCLPSSTTLAPEWEDAGHTLFNLWVNSEEVNELYLKRAIICYCAELAIRKYHLHVAPVCSTLEVANAHINIAKVHAVFALRPNRSATFRAKDRGATANHLWAAYKIRRDLLGNEHASVRQTWVLFQNA